MNLPFLDTHGVTPSPPYMFELPIISAQPMKFAFCDGRSASGKCNPAPSSGDEVNSQK